MADTAVQEALTIAVTGATVPEDLMMHAVRQMMSEEVPVIAAAGLLTALSARGEQMSEIAATARVLRERGLEVVASDNSRLVDTCGTGGTGKSLFNCSTCAALVATAAGARVAKHGNRTGTRASGSADLLEAAGVVLALTPQQAAQCLAEVGMVFLFAPAFHPAMRHMAPVRRELAIKTIFNLVGPITNPARVPYQVMGVPKAAYMRPIAEALGVLGGKRALVLHAQDGLDEISPEVPTDVVELCTNGELKEYRIEPKHFGVQVPLSRLLVTSVQDSLDVARRVLGGQVHPAADMVALNAAAALWVSGCCDSLEAGVELARQTLADGGGLDVLERLAAVSTRLATEATEKAGEQEGNRA